MIFRAVRRDSSYRLAGWPSSLALPSRCFLFCFLFLIPFLRGSTPGNKACGELFDREALRRVRTVCVDTSYLEEGVASDIRAFVTRENQPRQMLRQLPWELTDQCGAADAVIRVYFVESERFTREAGNLRGGMPSSSFSEEVIQAVLLIYDRASIRILYRTEGQDKGTNRTALLKGPFAKLIKDLKGAPSLTVLPAPPGR